jgi:hypothetical protein
MAAFGYVVAVGIRIRRLTGQTSALGVGVAMAGLIVGRLLDRFVPLSGAVDDWVNYRTASTNQANISGERYLTLLAVEVALLCLFAAVSAVLTVTLIKRDALGVGPKEERSPQLGLLVALFLAAAGLTARAKLAAFAAFALARANILQG